MSCNSCGTVIVDTDTNNCCCKPDVPPVPFVIPNCRKSIKDSLRVIECKPCSCECTTVSCTRRTKCHLPSRKDNLRRVPSDCCVPTNCCSKVNGCY